MTHILYDKLDVNSDTQELKLQRLSLPKTLFNHFKVAKIFLNIYSEFKVIIKSHNMYPV